MTTAYVGFGSNIDPEENIVRALEILHDNFAIKKISTFFYCRAEGKCQGQADYINGVVEVDVPMNMQEFKLDILRGIEEFLGVDRDKQKYLPRIIDLDLLLFGDVVDEKGNIPLPHPEIRQRDFIYQPLLEIEPNIVLPGSAVPLIDEIPIGEMACIEFPLPEWAREFQA